MHASVIYSYQALGDRHRFLGEYISTRIVACPLTIKEKLSTYGVNLCIHGLGLVLLLIFNDIAIYLYQEWFGGFDSRGIAPGAVTRLVILLFVITNLVIALAPIKWIKILLGVSFVFATAWFLLPNHPLRAIFYCITGGSLSFASIFAASWLNNVISKSRMGA